MLQGVGGEGAARRAGARGERMGRVCSDGQRQACAWQRERLYDGVGVVGGRVVLLAGNGVHVQRPAKRNGRVVKGRRRCA